MLWARGFPCCFAPVRLRKLRVELNLPEHVQAPLEGGTEAGTARVLLDGVVVAELPAVLAEDVQMPGYLEGFRRIREQWR